MIHLVNSTNRVAYLEEIKALHRARKTVFVDELGWKLAVRDGMEFDDYDDDRACSVIGFTPDNDVAMSVRMRPADDRSMLADHFAHVLPPETRPLNDGRTWEVSRGFCREVGRKPRNLRRKAACMLAPLEVAYEQGVDRLVGFSDVRMLTFFLNIGWRLTVLGEAVHYGEGDGFAYDVEVSTDAIVTMRDKWSLPNPSYIFFDRANTSGIGPFEFERELMMQNPELANLSPTTECFVRKPRANDYFAATVGHFDRRIGAVA